LGILLSGFLIIVIGLLDVCYDLSPYWRFIANLLISALVIAFGLGIPYISNPLGGIIRLDQWRISFSFLGNHSILVIADLLAIIWLTWIMNMVTGARALMVSCQDLWLLRLFS
jgi:UDP-GlcNAc:undecaprenyl-phosphate GlcNAc-1-phosphate transferase